MLKVELKEGTDVFTSDGKEVGKVNRFVLDPETNQVTHIVVQRGGLLSEDKVVPFEKIRSTTEDKIVLAEDIDHFEDLPPFEETHYVRINGAGIDNTRPAGDARVSQNPVMYYWYPPQGYLGLPAYGFPYYAWPPTETQQNIPENTVPLKEGTDVISSDGKHVGDVERLLLEPNTNRATHFVISQGLLFKDRKVVPAKWIKSVTDNEVRLTVASSVLEQLPSYES